MPLSANRKEYWRKNLRLTAWLLVIWFVVTFGFAFFALPISAFTIPLLDFPAAYYIAAQGALIVYVAILHFYARKMHQYDLQYDVDERDE